MNSNKLFDLSNLDEMLGGDRQAMLQMVKIFLQATPESLTELNNCFDKSDLDGVSKLAHKLKSSIDIFSIEEIKNDIRRMENLARENVNTEEIPALMEKVNNILNEAIEQVRLEKDVLQKELYAL
jgi:HPt (histidine-containing phosphotransfer) domain-containing protein